DSEEIFENQIRELVIKSLLGQDVTEATNKAQESIERAKREIEARRNEIDNTLGQLDALHRDGPQTPKLSRIPPGMSAKDFVLQAMRAEGARVEQRLDGVFEVSQPGRTSELVAFDEESYERAAAEAVFMGKARLYQPGSPHFERLVQHWVDHYGHCVQD